ncbi:MAG TPA: HD domain-containing phosphohydrolase [Candidatus Omnitrophota bacterium]|jgi:HD-GYP domain-containing protein (c-di-GMP phosphodiesterase class II)|nr:HD domain-containing phosphohydrolase [Candidatus Omnitrophota bacterium]
MAKDKKHYFQNTYVISNNERCKRVLSAVHMVYRLVNSTYNVKELSLRLTRLLCQFIRGKSARVILLDPDKKKIVLVAIFDNKINILLDKKSELESIPQKEIKVTEGYAIREKRLLGLPMVADENIGAIFIRRGGGEPPFTEFDREMLSVFAEQSVTAIKNLQLYEQQQKIILGSIKLIDKLLEKQGRRTGPHTPVYFYIAKSIAEMLNIGQEGIDCLYYASVLHDAGAIDVPYDILSKTSHLTPEEFNVIRELPNKSAELIRPVEFLGPVLPLVLYHHEKYDGTGYPSGLKKEQIPIGARIMAVVDAFEAMVCGRPYREKLNMTTAVKEIQLHSGTQFDPKVVRVFTQLYKRKKFRDYLSNIKR